MLEVQSLERMLKKLPIFIVKISQISKNFIEADFQK
jgi:hypothetical protein